MHLDDVQVLSSFAAHLPLIRALLDRLGILGIFDRLLPQHTLSEVSDGECVLALILNILSGRMALWRMQDWLALIDCELVLGEGVRPEFFNDTRLGQALDRIDALGTDTLLAEVVTRVLTALHRKPEWSAHLDTTSLVLYGEYAGVSAPVPAFGYSKDKRPDLKQLIFGLSIHGSLGIPLTYSLASGNTADPVSNRDHLAKLAAVLPPEDEVTIVGDCKLMDAITLGQLMAQGFHFVSLVPETFLVRGVLVDRAFTEHPDVASWPILAERAGAKKADPPTRYKGWSYTHKLRVLLETGEEGKEPVEANEELRFVVVHSDALVEKFDKSLLDRLTREREQVEEAGKALNRKPFSCENDARKAANKAIKKLVLHQLDIAVEAEEKKRKRKGPGRPKKDEVTPSETVWRVKLTAQPDEAAIAQQRRRTSCFVLASDWDTSEWDDAKVLAEYRHQSMIEGHTGFRWLKGEAAVAPIFLHNPSRIRALGLVFVLALMVRNYLQFTLRNRLAEQEETLLHPFRKKPDAKLTTEMALEWFSGIQTVKLALPGQPWQRAVPKLREQALKILALLELDPSIYVTPPARPPPSPGKSEGPPS